MPETTLANVRINSIHVFDSSVTTTAEPGSAAEWYMTFIVNGKSATWSNEDVKDDSVYPVGRDFQVDIGPTGMISVQASGYEYDSLSANDTLPTLSVTHHPAEEFKLGSTLWSATAASGEGSYNIEYSIYPAQPGGQFLTQAREYVSVYRTGTGPYALWAGNWKGFTDKWKELSEQGLRLNRVSTHRVDTGIWSFGDTSEPVFVGIFGPAGTGNGTAAPNSSGRVSVGRGCYAPAIELGRVAIGAISSGVVRGQRPVDRRKPQVGTAPEPYALWASDWPSFEAKWKELSEKGLRLVDLTPYLDGTKRMFIGVFRAGTDAHALWISEWPAFEKKWQELSSQNLRLVALDTYMEGATRMWVGVYRAGSYGHALWVGPEWKEFLAKRIELQNVGQHLIDVASYTDGGKQRFAGVFRAGADASVIKRGSWDDFVGDWEVQSNHGMRLVSVDTFLDPSED